MGNEVIDLRFLKICEIAEIESTLSASEMKSPYVASGETRVPHLQIRVGSFQNYPCVA